MHKTVLLLGLALASTTAAADTAVSLYNQGPAVVVQDQTLELKKGTQIIDWPELANPNILPASLWLEGEDVALQAAHIGQAAQSAAELLAGQIGQTVTFTSGVLGTSKQGKLVSVSGQQAVVTRDGKNTIVPIEQITWPAPAAAQQLTLDAKAAGEQQLSLVWQQEKLSWQASYSAQLDGDTLQLQPHAVLTNQGQTDLAADTLNLVAGDINRQTAAQPLGYIQMRQADAPQAKAVGAIESVHDYYRYPMNQPITLAAKSTLVVPLMPQQTLTAETQYQFNYYYSTDGQQLNYADINLAINNTTDQPLPAGAIRVYTPEHVLLGEARLPNLPKAADANITLGQAFDITAKHQITQRQSDGNHQQQTVKITLHNASDKSTTVVLNEQLPTGGKIESASQEPQTNQAGKQATWQLDIPAAGKTELTFKLEWTTR